MTYILRWAFPFTFFVALAACGGSSGGGSSGGGSSGGGSSGGGGQDENGCPADFATNFNSWPSGACAVGAVCDTGGECSGKRCSCHDGTWSCLQYDNPCGVAGGGAGGGGAGGSAGGSGASGGG